MIPESERSIAITLIDEAVLCGARRLKACEVLEITERTYYRWKNNPTGDSRKGAKKRVPRKLLDEEKQEILDVSCSRRFVDCNPYQITAILLDEKKYIASSSTFYRVLREKDMLHHRKKGRARKKSNPPPELAATGPNQVWSWDITYLKTEIKGIYLYAYIIIDVWSRKITGWEIHEEESETIARELFERLKGRYNLSGIKLHSDNGNPMKGATMIMTLYNLGIIPSFSRPRISDDNPYSESLFKTLKYTAGFPGCFKNLNHSRQWIADFVNWYNEKHRHSGIKYITPNQRHSGLGEKIMMVRNQVTAKAFSKNPQRWSHKPALWKNLETVFLNPSAETKNNDAA